MLFPQNLIISGSGVLNGEKKEDDCGVYAEADNGFGFQENCEYIHETVSPSSLSSLLPSSSSQF